MSYTIVLADGRNEANAYAKSAKLPRGRWRYPVSAAALRGIRVAEIHELPSWSKRRDRHAVEAELRYCRGERVIIGRIVADKIVADKIVADKIDAENIFTGIIVSDPRGPLTERQLEVAYRYHALRELDDLEVDIPAAVAAIRPDNPELADAIEAANPEPSEDPAPEVSKRRRSRCSDCNELDFPETHACPVALRAAAEKPTVLNATTPPVAAPAPIWD